MYILLMRAFFGLFSFRLEKKTSDVGPMQAPKKWK